MHSTLNLTADDPHDVAAIAPDVVPLAWADKVLADITRDAGSAASVEEPAAASGAAAPAPAVDTTFRATAVGDLHVANDRGADRPSTRNWTKSAAWVFTFTLCSAVAAASWRHYGDAATQTISGWAPPFALTASPPTEQTAAAVQTDAPAVPSAADRDAAPAAARAQPPEGAAASQDSAQLQSMARDLASMGQQIETLKASIAELKASQLATARDVARTSDARTSEVRPAVVTPSVQKPRPKPAPPRYAAAPSRAPMPAYAPVQAAAPPMTQALSPLVSPQAAPPPQAAIGSDGEPVVRPPMPLR